MKALVFESTLI